MTDDFTVTVRREIAAPAEVLFDAWLDAPSFGAWFRPGATKEVRAEIDARVGGEFRIVMVTDEADNVVTGTYREIDRPRRLVFTWSSVHTHLRDSVVTVTFEPSATSTLVEVHQIGLPDQDARNGHHIGWSDIVRELDRTHSPADTRTES